MDAATGTVSVTALILFIVFYWQQLWPKVQLWLMVAIGWGLGGMAGDWVNKLVGVAQDLSSKWGQTLLGVAFPAAIAVASLTIFIVFIWKDSKVRTGEVTWLVRIAALLVPLSIGMMPAIWGNIAAVLEGIA